MSMNIEFQLSSSIKNMVLSAATEQVETALEICGGKAESYAKRNLTNELKKHESWYKRTGALRNSITHKVITEGGVLNDEIEMHVGTNMEYAPYVEYGTGIFASDGNGRRTPWAYVAGDGSGHFTHGMKPRPFLKKSVADHMQEYEEIIEKVLKSN